MNSKLLELCARALWEKETSEQRMPWDEIAESVREFYRHRARIFANALLSHLSEESQALLRKELNGE